MSKHAHSAFTLVEVLVAMAITLLIMGTIVTVFSDISTSVADSKAGMEMSDQVQGVRDRLQRDLSGVTVSTKPWLRLESGSGYFEIIEGPRSDTVTVTGLPENGVVDSSNSNATQLTIPNQSRVPATALGDFDDVLMFTTHDPEQPFLGRGFQYRPNHTGSGTPPVDEAMIESNYAEVIWFAIEHPVANQGATNYLGEPVFRTIYRRALLIAPGTPIPSNTDSFSARQFYERYDISARRENGRWVANSLADLGWRVNRFAHQNAFPNLVDLNRIRPYNGASSQPSPLGPLGTELVARQGQDIMLRNALAFDVRVYDPEAPLRIATFTPPGGSSTTAVVAPGDPGWAGGTNSTDPTARGAFVDLNYANNNTLSWFSGPSQFVTRPSSGSGAALFAGNWDTWPFFYEQDGVTNNGGSIADEGTNGLDDNNNGFVDDPLEFETAPPYIAPLRGVYVRIRAYEPFSRQVREVTVVENFVGK